MAPADGCPSSAALRNAVQGAELSNDFPIPISVKDILDVAGMPTRWGSQLFARADKATTDIAAVARLRAAGATVIGKTTTTEFAHSPLSTSPLTGVTRNPWRPNLTPGGSSAGAGVSVATGVVSLALATDAGCSTRLPASCTATFGLKPTLGLIPHDRVPDAFGNFIHLGLIARSVSTLGDGLLAVAGPHSADPHSNRQPTKGSDRSGLRGKRVLMWMKAGNQRVSEEVHLATLKAAEVLSQLGATVSQAEYTLPNPDPIWRILQQSNWAARFATLPDDQRAQLSDSLRAGIDEALNYTGLDLARAQARRTELFRAVQRVFEDVDFILTPCASAPPVEVDRDPTEPLKVDNVAVGDLRSEWTTYLSLFDLTGHPALAMPVAFAENGGPIGVQLVARWDADRDLLAAAAEYERVLPAPIWRDESRR